MFRNISFLLFIISILLFISCGEDMTNAPIGDPSNLQMVIDSPNDGSSSVSIQATGDNVSEYEFYMGDESDLILNTTGLVSYSYQEDGVYTVEVKAYGVSGKFLKDAEIVQIGSDDSGVIDDIGYSTPTSYDGMNLIWKDEFDGALLENSNWNYETGTGSNGWGNNELQYYRKENTSVDQGFLIIEAKKEAFSGKSYTSSRLTSQNKFDFNFGRIDIRAKLPKGQGIWPALWMLGSNFNTVGWPSCGEIDIMEMIGGGEGKDDVVHGTLHWNNDGTKADYGGSKKLSTGIFNDEFHVFSIVWDTNSISWYLDDEQYHSMNITASAVSEFQSEFFFIFNVAVGGNWPGSPNSSTRFPQKMIVDYVRVFQEN